MSHTALFPLAVALFSGIASCAEPARIDKEPVAPRDELATTPGETQGGAVETPVAAATTEGAIAALTETPRHLAKAPAPMSKAWDDAAPIGMHQKGCEARRIDDYVRVRCTGGNRVEQLVGDPKTVKLGCFSDANPTCAVFHLAPGERRVVQFSLAIGGGEWQGLTLESVGVASAWWKPGETEPRISVD